MTEEMKKELEEEEKNEQLPVKEDGAVDSKAISNFKNRTIMQIQSDFSSGKIDADEGMKQIVNAVAIVEATTDPELRKTLKKNAAKSLRSYTKSITYKDDEKKIDRRQKRNEAFYKAFRPILEFDLSHLIGKKKRRKVTKDPATGKKTVSYEEIPEEPKKNYGDRSYGLILMLVMISLFVVPYCVANIILAIGRLVNSMFECFAQFGRTAFYICTSVGGIAIIGLVVYIVLLIIQSLFGVKIFA
ncbi:MAG: hypothetical protein ACI4R8_01080 [Candidatus Caccovivens sp.]